MFDNLTSINQFFFGLRSVAYRKSKTKSHGVCCRVQVKPKLRLNSGRFGVILSLLVCASLEFGYSCRWKQMYIIKTLASDIHPYRHPL